MPCIKCSNGKWRYGNKGRCQFSTLEACKRAEQAINIQNPNRKTLDPQLQQTESDCSCGCNCVKTTDL